LRMTSGGLYKEMPAACRRPHSDPAAYAVRSCISAAVRPIYSSKTLKAKPLRVLCSFLAILRINSASSRVQRMRMADLSEGMRGASCGTKYGQDSSGSL
jgi:hypothetical protein